MKAIICVIVRANGIVLFKNISRNDSHVILLSATPTTKPISIYPISCACFYLKRLIWDSPRKNISAKLVKLSFEPPSSQHAYLGPLNTQSQPRRLAEFDFLACFMRRTCSFIRTTMPGTMRICRNILLMADLVVANYFLDCNLAPRNSPLMKQT